MAQSTEVATSAGPRHQRRSRDDREETNGSSARSVFNFGLALALGTIVSYFVWSHIGSHLSVTTDVVGQTTYADFDVYRYLDRFYTVVVVFPAVTALSYFLIATFGPSRVRAKRPWPPELDVEDTETGLVAHPTLLPNKSFSDNRPDHGRWLRTITMLFIPAATVAIEVSVGASTGFRSLEWWNLAIFAGYVAVAVSISASLADRRRAVPPDKAAASRFKRGAQRANSLTARELPIVNAVLALSTIPLLVLVSSSTSVTIASDHHVARYDWLPIWLAVIATVGAMIVLVRALGHARTRAKRLVIERRVVLGVATPILIFMLTALLLGAQGHFDGFDDADALVGAHLTFGQGLWPWRDIFLLHGFFADDLYGVVGMWALSATRWGSNSGLTLFVIPVTIVALYTFIVYFARRNRFLIAVCTVGLVLGLLPGWPGTRYLLLPFVLIFLDRVLRVGSWGRCALLIACAIFFSIVSPEATLLMVGVLAVLVVAELVHRRPGEALVASFTRTLRCTALGVLFVGVWMIFLALTGSLSGFFSYYQTTISGHELIGAFPPQWSLTGDPVVTVEFVLPIVLFILTVFKAVIMVQRRSPWRTTDWVLLASATPVPLFYQLALDRMDPGHVQEVFQTLIPLVVLWSMDVLRIADVLIVRASNWVIQRWRARSYVPIFAPISALALVAILAGSPVSPSSWRSAPADFHASSPTEPPKSIPLGYTTPGSVNIAQVLDLRSILDRYAGKNAPIFDFANEMGVTYFLLNRVPGSHFYHIEAAQTATAQRLEIADLERSRPPVAIYYDDWFGLPVYDSLTSMARNYLVSQYILDHYTPILDAQGQLIMLRNDLLGEARPYPKPIVPTTYSNLYFQMPECGWGDVPNFLDHPNPASTKGSVGLALQRQGRQSVITLTGWAFDDLDHEPAREVMIASDGHVIATAQPQLSRPDVAKALSTSQAASSGFTVSFALAPGQSYEVYVLNADGTITRLPTTKAKNGMTSTATSEVLDGTYYPVRPSLGDGSVDSAVTRRATNIYLVHLPSDIVLAHYEWLEMSAPRFGRDDYVLTDQVAAGQSHAIGFNTLPQVGSHVFVRVGSCIQWHGYRTGELALSVEGPAQAFSVRLLK